MSNEPNTAQKVAREIMAAYAGTGGAKAVFEGREQFRETLDSIMSQSRDFEERGGVFFRAGSSPRETADNFMRVLESEGAGGREPLPSIVSRQAQELGHDKDSPGMKAAMMIAARAEIRLAVSPEYHGVEAGHFGHVASIAGELLKKNREMAARGESVPLDPRDEMIVLAVAPGHDIDHMGKGNPKDDPLFNERKSFEVMRPLMEEAGMSERDIQRAWVVQACTAPMSANRVLEEAERALEEGREPDFSRADPDNRFIDIQNALREDPGLVQMAGIVAASDLAASFGMDARVNVEMTRRLSQESGMNLENAGAQAFAHDNIVGAHMPSKAGRALFDDNYQKLRADAKAGHYGLRDDAPATLPPDTLARGMKEYGGEDRPTRPDLSAQARAALDAAPPDTVRAPPAAQDPPPTVRAPETRRGLGFDADRQPDTLRSPPAGGDRGATKPGLGDMARQAVGQAGARVVHDPTLGPHQAAPLPLTTVKPHDAAPRSAFADLGKLSAAAPPGGGNKPPESGPPSTLRQGAPRQVTP